LKTLITLALVGLLATACSKKKKGKLAPGELSDAQKTELRTKALANYKKLVEKYPDSPHAEKAKERVQALSAAQGGKK
jgi:parvulin-like peptidyl-prolyl isomerase